MTTPRTCAQCGAELPAGVPPWLCPRCLLAGLANDPTELECPLPGPKPPAGVGAATETLPQLLGGYELLERIGQGGMGVVYRARQLSLDRTVAVKLLPYGVLATEEQVQRFRTEAESAGSLQHPNIVAIYEVGVCGDRHFLVMEYVQGPTLAELARGGPLPPGPAGRYVQSIAEAVHHAHERGILHRDLKPSNVLIDAHDQPRITDFVIDITEPSEPIRVGGATTKGDANGVAVAGQYACVMDADSGGGIPGEGFLVFDIRDPRRPVSTGRCALDGPGAGALAVAGDYAYVLDNPRYAGDGKYVGGGFHVLDVSVGDLIYVVNDCCSRRSRETAPDGSAKEADRRIEGWLMTRGALPCSVTAF